MNADLPQIDPRTRLVELAAVANVSLSALSIMLGRNPSYLQQFVRKGSPRKLEEEDRRKLAEFFGVNEVELGAAPPREPQTGATVPDAHAGAHAGSRSVRTDGATGGGRGPMLDWIDVPRLPLGASAGPGAMADSELPIGQLRFSRRWLAAQGFEPATLSVIAVEGDSMEPTLRDGDEILVDQTPRPLRAGIHVVRLDDALLVKRLEPVSADRVRVISDNRSYGLSERTLQDVTVIGRVVWKGGRL